MEVEKLRLEVEGMKAERERRASAEQELSTLRHTVLALREVIKQLKDSPSGLQTGIALKDIKEIDPKFAAILASMKEMEDFKPAMAVPNN